MVSFLKKYIMIRTIEPKLKETTQLHFLKRLHRLLKNGYSLLAALEVVKWDKEMNPTASIMMDVLKKGYPLDEAFQEAHFHKTIVAYLYFVRINGNLLSSLEKCLIMFEHRITYIKKFTQVIRYPIVLSFTFIILLIFLKQSVLPSFLELFQSSTDSSKTVLYSMIIIDFVSTLFVICLVLCIVGTVFWHVYKRNVSVERIIAFYAKIPFVRSFIKLQTSYYFATHMSMFLKAGLSIKDTLTNMSKQEKLPIVAYYTTLMTEKFSNGFYIDHLLRNLPFIERQLASLFQKNNNAESLAKDLATYADFLAEDMERKIMRIITLIQPVFFVMLACFIILVYMTLMWPMFQLIQTV